MNLICASVRFKFIAGISTGCGVSLPLIWILLPLTVPVRAGLSAGPRALISAFTFPVTVVPGVRAMPEDAASFAISAIETLLAFRFTFNCAGVSFELTVLLMNSGVGPSLIVVLRMVR